MILFLIFLSDNTEMTGYKSLYSLYFGEGHCNPIAFYANQNIIELYFNLYIQRYYRDMLWVSIKTFWSQIQPHWAIRDGSQHTGIVTTYLIIHLMFLLCIFRFGFRASVYFLISHSLARERKLSYFQSPFLSPYYFKDI